MKVTEKIIFLMVREYYGLMSLFNLKENFNMDILNKEIYALMEAIILVNQFNLIIGTN